MSEGTNTRCACGNWCKEHGFKIINFDSLESKCGSLLTQLSQEQARSRRYRECLDYADRFLKMPVKFRTDRVEDVIRNKIKDALADEAGV